MQEPNHNAKLATVGYKVRMDAEEPPSDSVAAKEKWAQLSREMRAARERSGATVREMDLPYSASHISNIERGRAKPRRELAAAYDEHFSPRTDMGRLERLWEDAQAAQVAATEARNALEAKKKGLHRAMPSGRALSAPPRPLGMRPLASLVMVVLVVLVVLGGLSVLLPGRTSPDDPDDPGGTSSAAAKTCVGHPSDRSVACVRNGGRTLDVCDRDLDRRRAYARVATEASNPRFQSPFYDTNGSKAGCANLPFTSRIVSVAVCVQNEGCSMFKPTGVAAAPPNPQTPPPPPARPPARDVCAAHPSDASVACVRHSGHTVEVCDRDPDSHLAYARVVTEASSPSFLSPFYDGNDSQPGCANIPFPNRVLRVAVCVQTESCSAFKPT